MSDSSDGPDTVNDAQSKITAEQQLDGEAITSITPFLPDSEAWCRMAKERIWRDIKYGILYSAQTEEAKTKDQSAFEKCLEETPTLQTSSGLHDAEPFVQWGKTETDDYLVRLSVAPASYGEKFVQITGMKSVQTQHGKRFVGQPKSILKMLFRPTPSDASD